MTWLFKYHGEWFGNYIIRELQNILSWKDPLRSSRPTFMWNGPHENWTYNRLVTSTMVWPADLILGSHQPIASGLSKAFRKVPQTYMYVQVPQVVMKQSLTVEELWSSILILWCDHFRAVGREAATEHWSKAIESSCTIYLSTASQWHLFVSVQAWALFSLYWGADVRCQGRNLRCLPVLLVSLLQCTPNYSTWMDAEHPSGWIFTAQRDCMEGTCSSGPF